jgi:hypothetical protein
VLGAHMNETIDVTTSKNRFFEIEIIFVLTFHVMKRVALLASSNTFASVIRVAAMFALVMIGEYATKSEV